jgi:4-carboxymuconolactone decarboxylase
MTDPVPPPPRTFREFSERFPRIAEAWGMLSEAGAAGPLDQRTQRLLKLAIAFSTRSEGATHSAVRKALAAGVGEPEIYQVIALAASTIGLPAAAAAFSWVEDEMKKR